jgi:hypothetical protein
MNELQAGVELALVILPELPLLHFSNYAKGTFNPQRLGTMAKQGN